MSRKSSLRAAVRHTLLASAAIAPTCFITPSAAAQEIPGLTPNVESTGFGFADLCSRLANFDGESQGNGQGPQTPQEFDILDRCFGIFGGEGGAPDLTGTLSQLGAQDYNAFRTQVQLFGQTQFESVKDRLLAIRSGRRGGTVAASLRPGQDASAPLLAINELLPFGGGASADEPDGLLGDRLGFWMRGNYGDGEKELSVADSGFDSNQSGLTLGADYRIGTDAVAGASIGYGRTDLAFAPDGRGGFDADSWSASAYGSAYLGGAYLDGVVNYVSASYDTSRRLHYVEVSGDTIDQDFAGKTDGDTLTVAVATGYDFVAGALTIAPSIGYTYLDGSIDGFTENENFAGTPGYALNLAVDEQNFKSATANATLRLSYAWKLAWGVVVPHFRGTYVHEFEDDVEVFGVRFANDPYAGTADPTTPIVVTSDVVDDTYYRLAIGASAQFKGNVSGYFEYQRLESFDHVDFQDFTVGLRILRSF